MIHLLNEQNGSKKGTFKRTPLSRVWFLGRGFLQVPTDFTGGKVLYYHPAGYFFNQYGQRLAHNYSPAPYMRRPGGGNRKGGSCYPSMCNYGSKNCHFLAALALSPSPQYYQDKNGKPYRGVVHHLIPDVMNYSAENLLYWLSRKDHATADKRQRMLRDVVPGGNLQFFSYSRLRVLQDPRITTDADFLSELEKIKKIFRNYIPGNIAEIMEADLTQHREC